MIQGVGEVTAHKHFYSLEIQGVGWWQRVIMLPSTDDAALIALQAVDPELDDPTESFNYATDLVVAFAHGQDMDEALARLGKDTDPISTLSGAAGRRLGRLFTQPEFHELLWATAAERGRTRVVFTIPDGKPDTRYEQFAKQFDFVLDKTGPQRMWVRDLK